MRLALLCALSMAPACGPGSPPETASPARESAPTARESAPTPATEESACRPPQTSGPWSTRLRGRLAAPDPRSRQTLLDRGGELTPAGLREALADASDPTGRVAALAAVSAIGCDRLLDDVAALVGAKPPIAVEAAATLIERGGPEAAREGRARLRSALSDSSWPAVQLTAALYLARDGDASGFPQLREALASDLDAIRLQAVQAAPAFASSTGDGPSVFDLLERAARRDPSWMVRRAAVEELAGLPDSDRVTSILRQVAEDDSNERVRRTARSRLRSIEGSGEPR